MSSPVFWVVSSSVSILSQNPLHTGLSELYAVSGVWWRSWALVRIWPNSRPAEGRQPHSGSVWQGTEALSTQSLGVYRVKSRSALTHSWTVQATGRCLPPEVSYGGTLSHPNGADILFKYLNFICQSSREGTIRFYSKRCFWEELVLSVAEDTTLSFLLPSTLKYLLQTFNSPSGWAYR